MALAWQYLVGALAIGAPAFAIAASNDFAISTTSICTPGETCLVELSDANFETFVGTHAVSCIVFYQPDRAQWNDQIIGEFQQLSTELAKDGPADFGVATMVLDSGNIEVSRSVAATGPISVKLFDQRLRSQNNVDLYSLHTSGPQFRLDSKGLVHLLRDYKLNSTGLSALDNFAEKLVTVMLSQGEESAKTVMQEARAYSNELGKDLQHISDRYLKHMSQALDQGIFTIAKAFNIATLELGRAAGVTAGTARLSLADRASLLLDLHITTELSKALLEDGAPQYKHKVESQMLEVKTTKRSEEFKEQPSFLSESDVSLS
mmetsp:Transcript_12345/g.22905  ORF Transcript_12345/g.22905 Transcript_12345/m.22905 type:complete len:319 (-) Transcript_12345:49-1005(-)